MVSEKFPSVISYDSQLDPSAYNNLHPQERAEVDTTVSSS